MLNLQLSQIKTSIEKKKQPQSGQECSFSILILDLTLINMRGCKQMAPIQQPAGGVYFCVRSMLASLSRCDSSYPILMVPGGAAELDLAPT